MLNGIDALNKIFTKYKNIELRTEKDESYSKKIDNILNNIENRKYIENYDIVEEIVKRYETSEMDLKLLECMLNVNRYNIYIMNKNLKFVEPDLNKNIEFNEVKIDVKDVLNYLEVDIEDLNSDLISDLEKYIDKDKFIELATYLKGSQDIEHIIYDKLNKDELVSLILNSNIDLIKEVISKFKKEECNLSKIISIIPSIFVKDLVSKKCKYNIMCNYDIFMENCSLLEKYKIPFRLMLNYPIFFINDNKHFLEELDERNLNVYNIICYTGNISVLRKDIILKNIDLLKFHKIELTDDNNNNGYTILGMEHLDDRIDYLIEQGKWNISLGEKHDNIDLVRALIIKDDYIKWKNKEVKDIELNDNFLNKILTEEDIKKLYEKHELLTLLDKKYKKDNNYNINDVIISKHRLLSNMNNYIGSGNQIKESLGYKSTHSNEKIENIYKIIMEMDK